MTFKEHEEMLIKEFLNWKKDFKKLLKEILFKKKKGRLFSDKELKEIHSKEDF